MITKTGRRVLSGIVAFMMATTPFAGVKSGKTVSEKDAAEGSVKTVTVSPDGDCKTLEEARDYVRTLDKKNYSGIEVVLEAGTYVLDDTFTLTEEDSGTADCPITYRANGDVTVTGAVELKSSDFSPAEGEATQWFKDEAKDNIVSFDLKAIGYSATMMTELYESNALSIVTRVPMLYHGDERLVLARYPNEGYITSAEGTEIEGGESAAVDLVTPLYVYFGEEYADTVRSWHAIEDTYVWQKLSYFWCDESSDVRSVDPEKPMVTVSFTGGHDPQDYGMPLYFYNIPEELDYPGEYFIDEDSILYVYKYEDFDGSVLSIPTVETGVYVQGADYLTFDGIHFTSFSGTALNVYADHFTLKNCKISNATDCGARIVGDDNLIERNELTNLYQEGLHVGGGDEETMELSHTVVTNNKIHDFGQDEKYSYGLSLAGVGVNANHNEIYDCPHIAVYFSSNLCVFEYNYVHDCVLRADDVGALACDGEFGAFGNTVRYNYITDIGPTEPVFMCGEIDCYFPKCGASAIYWDCMGSGQTMYGNVINHVYGNSLMSSGKMHKYENNLIVACAKHAIELNCDFYSSYFYGDNAGRGAREVPDYFTEGLLKTFPELAALEFTEDAATADNPTFWSAPTGGVVRNNIVYTDKGYRSKEMNYALKPYSIEKYIYDFSTIELNDEIFVNSKRGGYDIDELVKEHADTLGMTYEEFKSVGIQ